MKLAADLSQDAQAAVIRFNSFDKFTISSKPVIVDYVHAGVFVPAFNAAEDPEEFTFSPLSTTATRLAYWDKDAYVSELVVSSGSTKRAAAGGESQVKSAADLAAAAAEGEGLVQLGKEGEAKAKKRKAEAATAAAKPKKVWAATSWIVCTLMYADCSRSSSILEQPSR